jgi:predicted Fe-Mo cluster-binding NifX family protein
VDQSSIRRLADLGEEYAQLSSKNALTSGAPGTSTAEIAIMRNIDCIILWNFNMYATGIQQMENAGLKVVALNPNDVASVLDVISIIGTLMDKEDIAAELIGNIGSTIENITELAKEKAGAGYGNFKRVYIELDTASRTSPGTNSITGAMLDMLGVNYISKANGVTASRSYGEEEIIGFNPDIMIFMGPIVPCGYDVRNFGTFVSYDPVTYNSGEGFNGNWASATPSFINGLIFLYELIYGEAYAP